MVVNNPNNWHWVDKNCIDWTREYFSKNVVGLKAEEDSDKVQVTKIKSLEGDVEVCQRKGKVISLFDFNTEIEITGNDNINGTITIPEISYDQDYDDYQFEISLDGSLNDTDKLKKLTRNKLIPQLRKVISQFGPDLIATNSSDIQVSKDQVKSEFTKANQQEFKVKQKTQTSTFINKSSSSDSKTTLAAQKSSLYNTTSLDINATFNTSAEQIFITFLDPQRVSLWSRSAAQIEPKEGSEFKLFGGNIQGKILKLVTNEEIQMLWRLLDWKEGHYTTLTIKFKQNDSDTSMYVNFQGVPIGEEEKVQGNFQEYYVKSIKITFGFGAVL